MIDQSSVSQLKLRDTYHSPMLLGWMVIVGFILLTMIGTFGAAKAMNYVYPASAFAASLFLYHRYPLLWHGFAWWLFFLTPLVRRIVDYRSSFVNPSPILLAPVLAMLVILPSFIIYFPRLSRDNAVPFGLSGIAVGYGFIMGYLYQVPWDKLILGSLGWLSPIMYGFYIFINWRRYPEFRKNFERTLTWGIFVMGIYGIFQYLTLPEWDRLWLINAEFHVAGNPFPREIRVWSTMNSGEPFSAVMAAGLILLLNGRSPLVAGASVAGYITFLLTLVRAGWLGWAGGMLVLFATSTPKFQGRLVFLGVAFTGLVLPISIASSFSDVIGARLSTFSDLENDGSVNARQDMYQQLGAALEDFLGHGIRSFGSDSAIFSLLGEFGWVGGIPYIFGLLGLIFACWKTPRYLLNDSSRLMFAAAVTGLVRIPGNSSLVGVSGMLLWGCLSFFLAGAKYSHNEAVMHQNHSIHSN
jgi:hypothetical protein